MAEAEVTNKRAFRRIPTELPLRFLNLAENKWRLTKTCDISAQGIGLISEEELPRQASIETWVSLPDVAEPLYSRGRVAWSEKLSPDKYRVGINLEKPNLLARILQTK